MVISELFINLTILTSLLFLYHQFFKDATLSRKSRLNSKILIGCLSGALGIILMLYSIKITENTIIDLRQIPVMLVALYGGWVPAFVAGIMILVTRFIIGFNLSSVLAFVLLLTSTVCYVYVSSKVKNIWKATFISMIFTNIMFTILTYLLLPDGETYLIVNLFYWLVSFVGGYSSIYMIEYLRKTNLLFKEYRENAFIDPLTGLNNVRSFDKEINESIKRAKKVKEELSLLVIDIDFFKKINDTYGHPEGDAILKQVGKLLQEQAGVHAVVSRNGGEEFTVILKGSSNAEAIQKAEKVRRAIEEFAFLINKGATTIHLTVSIGVSTYPDSTQDTNELYRLADHALYEAKQDGRNRVATQ
ncbi:GGDEF domain-containing protein [Bacillus weihaiensis]|uniref:GGDEF domain-containing protein n=1 Tax=Bacillus weihaiensis TaxID=1547283 RepID=A0A1L3MTT5_9BACI|nr:diguanylate cyclase [Bacillus weihaiensis]APH05751.1 hypothetical protein A9C19_13990 [Bacillus weihaiensis]